MPETRIEAGPARLTAVATEELLSDEVTAEHYYAGVRETRNPAGEIVNKRGVDSQGRPIILGNEMEYLDWKGPPGFYVYKLEDMTPEELEAQSGLAEADRVSTIWRTDSFHATEAEAQARAAELA